MKTQTTPERKTGLQKSKVDRLFLLDKITPEDLDDLSEYELKYYNLKCGEWLRGDDCAKRDDFLKKIALTLSPDVNDQLWERNHATITDAVSNYMSQHGVMPTKNTIARETGLSRQTVIKHLKEYARHPEFAARAEQFKFMAPHMLANIYKTALKGDMRAARLYLETVGETNKKQPATTVNQQKNYIQINNTILSQENLKQLTHEQLVQIESIVNNKKLMEVGEAV